MAILQGATRPAAAAAVIPDLEVVAVVEAALQVVEAAVLLAAEGITEEMEAAAIQDLMEAVASLVQAADMLKAATGAAHANSKGGLT